MARRRVVVTVGMGPWPFDRLMHALPPVCARHDVFAQIGTATVTPPCPHARFIAPDELQRRIDDADVVVTHAGNTVRLVQRRRRVPIAVARRADLGEIANDHQLLWLDRARRSSAVVAGDLARLASQIDEHPHVEQDLLRRHGCRDAADVTTVRDRLRRALTSTEDSPFRRHPTRRYHWAFSQLATRDGRHLDLGCERGTLLAALADHTRLDVTGGEPMAPYRADLTRRRPDLAVVPVGRRDPLPFADGHFDSVSLLDVLEHVADETFTLREIHRVLRPGGVLLVTVPARHVLSWMDPDNAKFRMPRVHRAVYGTRFGRRVYHQRFVDTSDGMRGDLDVARSEHHNYAATEVMDLLRACGFVPVVRDGAHLFRLLFQIPSLLLPARVRALCDAPLRLDGRLFHHADLFIVAERVP